MKYLSQIFVFSVLFSSSASLAGELGIIGGWGINEPVGVRTIKSESFSYPQTNSAKMIGITGYQHFAKGVGLEIDLIYMPVSIGATTVLRDAQATKTFQETSFNFLTLPVIARYNLFQYFMVGIGGYYSRAMDNAPATSTENSVVNTSTRQGFGYKDYDFGIIGSLQVSMPLVSQLALVGDLRYQRGLVNMALDSDAKHQIATLLAGIIYNF